MDDGEILIQAIEDDPEDDGPRLAYADWLEERGDVRGEFIRAQCELAKLARNDPRRERPWKRECELLVSHGSDWSLMDRRYLAFRRGFVERLYVYGEESLQRFLARVDDLFRPWLINTLEARGEFEDGTMRALAGLSRLASLRRLILEEVGAETVRVLSASPHLCGVESIRLGRCSGGDPHAFLFLLESGALRNAKELDLKGTVVITSHQEDTSNPWDPMAYVIVNETSISPNIGFEGVLALSRTPGASRLRVLDVSHNEIGDAGAEALLRSPYLANLEKLVLDDATIGIAAREAIRARFGCL